MYFSASILPIPIKSRVYKLHRIEDFYFLANRIVKRRLPFLKLKYIYFWIEKIKLFGVIIWKFTGAFIHVWTYYRIIFLGRYIYAKECLLTLLCMAFCEIRRSFACMISALQVIQITETKLNCILYERDHRMDQKIINK